MKFSTYRINNRQRVGLWDDTTNSMRPLLLSDGTEPSDLVALIAEPALLGSEKDNGDRISLKDIKLLAPIPAPHRNIFCIGKNYRNHIKELSNKGLEKGQSPSADVIPEYPIVFTKTPQTVIAHGDKVWSAAGVSRALDYEAELAVIIGKGGRGIKRADAMNHVWGYTIVNDVTARDWQKRHSQWHLGKSFDTFCPMGPVAVTADELDGTSLGIKCWINGELRQNGNTRDLIFDIPTLIETISAGITLIPGDIIATGTPEGVGFGFDPPKFLKHGDVIEIEIQGIGRLKNEVD